jgi:hypothetical protein
MPELQEGDAVNVNPVGHPDQCAAGTIVIVSSNGVSIGIAFGEKHVPWMNGATGMAIHPDHGKMLLAKREGETWSDIFSSGQFMIERAT